MKLADLNVVKTVSDRYVQLWHQSQDTFAKFCAWHVEITMLGEWLKLNGYIASGGKVWSASA